MKYVLTKKCCLYIYIYIYIYIGCIDVIYWKNRVTFYLFCVYLFLNKITFLIILLNYSTPVYNIYILCMKFIYKSNNYHRTESSNIFINENDYLRIRFTYYIMFAHS